MDVPSFQLDDILPVPDGPSEEEMVHCLVEAERERNDRLVTERVEKERAERERAERERAERESAEMERAVRERIERERVERERAEMERAERERFERERAERERIERERVERERGERERYERERAEVLERERKFERMANSRERALKILLEKKKKRALDLFILKMQEKEQQQREALLPQQRRVFELETAQTNLSGSPESPQVAKGKELQDEETFLQSPVVNELLCRYDGKEQAIVAGNNVAATNELGSSSGLNGNSHENSLARILSGVFHNCSMTFNINYKG